MIMTFAFATPVGIGFGFVLSSVTTSNGAAAISALASGANTPCMVPRVLSESRLSKVALCFQIQSC